MEWQPLSVREGRRPPDGPYEGVPVHLKNGLLSWLRRFIALRKEYPVFGRGSYEPLGSDNPRIFAHIRRWNDDVVVCVQNLARSAQPVQLDLSAFRGLVPEEMFGRTLFPLIGDLPYLLTLKPRGFFWFRLREA